MESFAQDGMNSSKHNITTLNMSPATNPINCYLMIAAYAKIVEGYAKTNQRDLPLLLMGTHSSCGETA